MGGSKPQLLRCLPPPGAAAAAGVGAGVVRMRGGGVPRGVIRRLISRGLVARSHDVAPQLGAEEVAPAVTQPVLGFIARFLRRHLETHHGQRAVPGRRPTNGEILFAEKVATWEPMPVMTREEGKGEARKGKANDLQDCKGERWGVAVKCGESCHACKKRWVELGCGRSSRSRTRVASCDAGRGSEVRVS